MAKKKSRRNSKLPDVQAALNSDLPAKRAAEVPADILLEINEGRRETTSMVEWNAVNVIRLSAVVLKEAGREDLAWATTPAALVYANASVLEQIDVVGRIIAQMAGDDFYRIFEHMSTHTSDVARELACFAVGIWPIVLQRRLSMLKPLAADSHPCVRECAWMAVREDFCDDPHKSLPLVRTWVKNKDANIRRFAVEVSRPRGNFCPHIDELKTNPEMGEFLLEPLKHESVEYVQKSVIAWIQDAKKSRADWAKAFCKKWKEDSPSEATLFMIDAALKSTRASSTESTTKKASKKKSDDNNDEEDDAA